MDEDYDLIWSQLQKLGEVMRELQRYSFEVSPDNNDGIELIEIKDCGDDFNARLTENPFDWENTDISRELQMLRVPQNHDPLDMQLRLEKQIKKRMLHKLVDILGLEDKDD